MQILNTLNFFFIKIALIIDIQSRYSIISLNFSRSSSCSLWAHRVPSFTHRSTRFAHWMCPGIMWKVFTSREFDVPCYRRYFDVSRVSTLCGLNLCTYLYVLNYYVTRGQNVFYRLMKFSSFPTSILLLKRKIVDISNIFYYMSKYLCVKNCRIVK